MKLFEMSKKYCLSESEILFHAGAAIYGLGCNCPSFQLDNYPSESEFYLSLLLNGVVSGCSYDDHSYFYACFVYSAEFTANAKELFKDVLVGAKPKD